MQDFPGALVLVSHDRYLLDSVCEQVLGFDNLGGVIYYADYEQWLADLKKNDISDGKSKIQVVRKESAPKKKQSKAGKLSYMDQREYEQMEEKIMEVEEEKESLQALMDDPETAKNPQKLESTWAKLEAIKQQVEQMYERWDELEEKKLSDR